MIATLCADKVFLFLLTVCSYNEPGWERERGTPAGKKKSDAYSLNIRRYTLEHAMRDFLQQLVKGPNAKLTSYPEFTSVVLKHFLQRADAIDEQITQWNSEDKTLNKLANNVRELLHTLAAMHASKEPLDLSSDSEESSSPAAAAAVAPAAASKGEPECIDLC